MSLFGRLRALVLGLFFVIAAACSTDDSNDRKAEVDLDHYATATTTTQHSKPTPTPTPIKVEPIDTEDDPSQTECTTIDLGSYASDSVVLGQLFKVDCTPNYIKVFVVKNNTERQVLEYIKFQTVLIGNNSIVCPSIQKRFNIDGILLEKLKFNDDCELIQ